MNKLPVVVIAGRPNVGKSSLFNRIVGHNKSIVEEASGTTRDRIFCLCKWQNKSFELVDTGGLLSCASDKITKGVLAQARQAIEKADLFILVCDITAGLTAMDEEVFSILRKTGKKIFLALNKVDNIARQEQASDFYRLGIENTYLISALMGKGIGDLLDGITEYFKKDGSVEPQGEIIKMAIVGRPNSGKSSLLNYILKEERVIVDEEPGTTRDSIDTYFTEDGCEFLLIDTAGIRHKRKLKEAVSFYSIAKSQQSIRRADVCILLIDAASGLAVDDLKILDYIIKYDKGCIVVVNKWDLVKSVEMAKYRSALLRRADFLRKYPLLFISAKTGRNVSEVLNLAKQVYKSYNIHIQTKLLNDELDKVRPRFKYIAQAGTQPPAFIIFTKNPQDVREQDTGFIENNLRQRFELWGVPIKISYRKG